MRPVSRPLALALLLALAAGCGRDPAVPAPTGLTVILCAGDSITAASYPDHLQELLAKDGFRVQVVNAGKPGDNTAEYLRYLEKSGIVERTNPDWVLLQLGTNDLRIDGHATTTEQFRKNLEAILDRIGQHRTRAGAPPGVVLATIPPIPVEIARSFDAGSRARVESQINPAIRDIARSRALSLSDTHALFAARPELLPDIHPTEEGYRALAETWRRVLAPLLPPPAAGKTGAR